MTVSHFWHPSVWNAVSVVNFETLISELTNVSHIWLPERARIRRDHSLCLVFYNEFDAFAQKVMTVTHLGHPAIGIPCFFTIVFF